MSSSMLVLCAISIGINVIQFVTAEDDSNLQPNEKKYPECGPNEVLNTCVQCPGEDNCYEPNRILCPAAFLPCYPKCVCKEGFIRKSVGRECIPKEECGTPCDIFEVYTDCKECANDRCSSIDNPVKCDGKEKCTPGCVCWDGYYKDEENSLCLDRCSCPQLKDSPDCSYWNTSSYLR